MVQLSLGTCIILLISSLWYIVAKVSWTSECHFFSQCFCSQNSTQNYYWIRSVVMSFDVGVSNSRIIRWKQGPFEENECFLYLVDSQQTQTSPVPSKSINFLFDCETLIASFLNFSKNILLVIGILLNEQAEIRTKSSGLSTRSYFAWRLSWSVHWRANSTLASSLSREYKVLRLSIIRHCSSIPICRFHLSCYFFNRFPIVIKLFVHAHNFFIYNSELCLILIKMLKFILDFNRISSLW